MGNSRHFNWAMASGSQTVSLITRPDINLFTNLTATVHVAIPRYSEVMMYFPIQNNQSIRHFDCIQESESNSHNYGLNRITHCKLT